MEEHELDTVEIEDTEIFKDVKVKFNAIYQYCHIGDKLLETEEMFRANTASMKNAYNELIK